MKPVSKEVIKALPLLKFVANEPNKSLRNDHLRKMGGDLTVFDAMSEISKNYLNKKISLEPYQSKIVERPKNLKRLKIFQCNKIRKDCKKRQIALEQIGGFLPFLIPAAATVIAEILSKYIK